MLLVLSILSHLVACSPLQVNRMLQPKDEAFNAVLFELSSLCTSCTVSSPKLKGFFNRKVVNKIR